jgi:hypothetical protein
VAYHRLRVFFIVAACFLVTSGVFVGCILALLPLDILVEDLRPVASVRPAGKEKINAIPGIAEFGQTLTKRFQEPLEDAAPAVVCNPETAIPVVAAAPLDVVLLGTAVESTAKSSKAWLRAAGQPLRLVGVGEKLLDLPGEPELVSIEVGSVVLRVGDHEQTVTMAKPELK